MFSTFCVIALITVFLHWKLLFGATVSMDGWILENWRKNRDFEMKRFYRVTGLPIIGFMHEKMGNGRLVRQKYGFAILLSLVIGNFSVFQLISKFEVLSTEQRLLLVALFMTYTGKSTTIDTVVGLQYVVTYNMFLFGVLLLWEGALASSLPMVMLVAVGIAFLTISFSTKSLLFLTVLVSCVVLLVNEFIYEFGKLHWLLLFLIIYPFIFWKFMESLFPRNDNYTSYNQFLNLNVKNVLKIVFSYTNAFRSGIYEGLISSFRSLLTSPATLPLTALLIFSERNLVWQNRLTRDQFIIFMLAFLVLFIGWCFPYIIVGQEFDYYGYLSKNNLMADLSYMVFFGGILLSINPSAGYLGAVALIWGSYLQIQKNYNHQIKDFLKNKDFQLCFRKNFKPYTGELIVTDDSRWRLNGKKAKLYPMTLFYMLNPTLVKARVLPSNSYISKPGLVGVVHELFESLELPFEKQEILLVPRTTKHVIISDILEPTDWNLYKTYANFLRDELKEVSNRLGIIQLTEGTTKN